MVALCAHMLVERGLLDLDAPVARNWQEFAQADKAHIPVRWLLGHRAGLPALRRDMPPQSLHDWHALPCALAEEAPWWTPGTQHGYHAHLPILGGGGHSAGQRQECGPVLPHRGGGTPRN